MAFGEMLVNLRKTKGLSQEQLAEELNLTRQTISKWELNQSTPDINYLVRLSDFFGVTADYLIKGEEEDCVADSESTYGEASSDTNHDVKILEKDINSVNAYKWCFYLGTVSMGVSMLGMIAFMICSAMSGTHVVVDEYNRYYDGTLGFLMFTNTLWFFIVLVVLFIAGGVLAGFGIVKGLKMK